MNLMYTAHVPRGDGPFPTVFALHGWGASAHDLLGLAPFLLRGEALVICPQGPVDVPIGPGMQGHGWFPLAGGGPLDLAAFRGAADELRGFLAEAGERYPVDPRKQVLLGFSQGGVLAYELALRAPERWAGLAALSAWLPRPLAEDVPHRDEHKGFPVFVCHGTEDEMISVERARESRDVLLPFDVGLTYREYPMGHEIRPETLRDLLEWLESKVVSPIQLA